MQSTDSGSTLLAQFLQGIAEVDCDAIQRISDADISLSIPGAGDVTLTQTSIGPAAVCDWAKTVKEKCGKIIFKIEKCIEVDGDVMAVGSMTIDDYPQLFNSRMAIHIRFMHGTISAFELFFDTHALSQFRW